MAFIGMRHIVCAELESHTPGAEPTYETGLDVGGAIRGALTINRNNNGQYYDDVLGEDDNGIVSFEIELELNDISEEVQAYMGILKEVTAGTPSVTTYYDTSASTKPVGFGYMRVRRLHDVTSYQAVWFYKCQFSKNNESSQTKAESIEWQNTTISGKCSGLAVTGDGEYSFRKMQNFTTAAAAAAWLDALAGISRT